MLDHVDGVCAVLERDVVHRLQVRRCEPCSGQHDRQPATDMTFDAPQHESAVEQLLHLSRVEVDAADDDQRRRLEAGGDRLRRQRCQCIRSR